MFKPSMRCCSALTKRTKRVQVQILKDFPRFQLYTGEVAQVKPSIMRNFLHNSNGARYILKETDIDQTLLALSKKKSVLPSTKPRKTKHSNAAPKSVETKSDAQKKEAPSTALNDSLTIENVKIPGLEL